MGEAIEKKNPAEGTPLKMEVVMNHESMDRIPAIYTNHAEVKIGAEEIQSRAGGASSVAQDQRGAAHRAATGVAAGQRGARREGHVALRTEARRRAEEQRSGAGATRPRGEGRAAFGELQVQERVPRQHEPRVADSAQ